LHKGKEDYFRQKDYLLDVEICQQFVKRNRAEMGTKIQKQGKVFRNGNTRLEFRKSVPKWEHFTITY